MIMDVELIKTLLKDQTTEKNILWANAEFGAAEIEAAQVESIKPRYDKIREHQKQRTRDRAEIFTPPDICKIQNDLIDVDNKSWQDYVDAKFLEITCGEAPYLVNRYNAVDGKSIPLAERVGFLDRKLRVVTKETSAPKDWIDFATRAVKSIYGYELQGDSLYLARLNVFETVKDYYREKFQLEPPKDFLKEIAEIISWNLWQMDGLTYSPPFTDSANLFGGANCKIMDWKTGKPFEFGDLVKGVRQ